METHDKFLNKSESTHDLAYFDFIFFLLFNNLAVITQSDECYLIKVRYWLHNDWLLIVSSSSMMIIK